MELDRRCNHPSNFKSIGRRFPLSLIIAVTTGLRPKLSLDLDLETPGPDLGIGLEAKSLDGIGLDPGLL